MTASRTWTGWVCAAGLAIGPALVLGPGLAGCSSGPRTASLGIDPVRAVETAERAKKAVEDENLEKALVLYQEATELDPNNPSIWLNYGAVLIEVESYYDAQQAFERAQRLDPTSPLPHVNKGITWLRAGWAEQAVDHFEKALELDPDHLGALRGFTRAKEELGESDPKTLDIIERALLEETDASWRDYLNRQRTRVRQGLDLPSDNPEV